MLVNLCKKQKTNKEGRKYWLTFIEFNGSRIYIKPLIEKDDEGNYTSDGDKLRLIATSIEESEEVKGDVVEEKKAK